MTFATPTTGPSSSCPGSSVTTGTSWLFRLIATITTYHYCLSHAYGTVQPPHYGSHCGLPVSVHETPCWSFNYPVESGQIRSVFLGQVGIDLPDLPILEEHGAICRFINFLHLFSLPTTGQKGGLITPGIISNSSDPVAAPAPPCPHIQSVSNCSCILHITSLRSIRRTATVLRKYLLVLREFSQLGLSAAPLLDFGNLLTKDDQPRDWLSAATSTY